ncbi:hypothetical protein [Agromyces mangrovi Wang et al. 2018]|uniref:hypothetical protein n=1 Tax=Agromyces mangrovi TaxID=1858653 RepID=UPI002572AE26|nr:hypothetical protein [Agromyces mangrovi]BDZ65119.1 hypothetical protein GCM10025877_20570 [Agromyces mangrovi]
MNDDLTQEHGAPDEVADTGPRRPAIRWASVIWGAAFAAAALALLWIATDEDRLREASAWLWGLSVNDLVLWGIVLVGGLLFVAGLAGLATRGSRLRLEVTRD